MTPKPYISYNVKLFNPFSSLWGWFLDTVIPSDSAEQVISIPRTEPGVRTFGFPSLGISCASPQATGGQRCQQTQGHRINGWEQGCAPVTYFPGLIPLPYFGGLMVTTYELIPWATAPSLVLWIIAIHWIVRKYPLPYFYAAYFLSSKLSQLLVSLPQDQGWDLSYSGQSSPEDNGSSWLSKLGLLPFQSHPQSWHQHSAIPYRERRWEELLARRQERREGGWEVNLEWLN